MKFKDRKEEINFEIRQAENRLLDKQLDVRKLKETWAINVETQQGWVEFGYAASKRLTAMMQDELQHQISGIVDDISAWRGELIQIAEQEAMS